MTPYIVARRLLLQATLCDNLVLPSCVGAAVFDLLQPCGAVEPPGGVRKGGEGGKEEGGKGEKYTLNNSYLGKLGTPCHASSWEGFVQQGWVLLH